MRIWTRKKNFEIKSKGLNHTYKHLSNEKWGEATIEKREVGRLRVRVVFAPPYLDKFQYFILRILPNTLRMILDDLLVLFSSLTLSATIRSGRGAVPVWTHGVHFRLSPAVQSLLIPKNDANHVLSDSSIQSQPLRLPM